MPISINKISLLKMLSLRLGADESSAVENIKSNVDFSGSHLWTLILAIFIASVGLNVNSTAVIIGAMLISPLMGPIVGGGLALGTNDFQLFKRSLRNLSIATLFSVATSTAYFLLSPLAEAQSELLARTSPTIYDVLIALFGGAAGMVAGSRKGNHNAVAGVAIATALMPPLCTAGFGLSQGDWRFFFGALYLYFINSVFICLATFIVVRALKFKEVAEIDKALAKRRNYYMVSLALLFVVPSIYTAYKSINEAVLTSRVNQFVRRAFEFKNTKVVEHKVEEADGKTRLLITVLGVPLTETQETVIRERAKSMGLSNIDLQIIDAGLSAAEALENKIRATLKPSVPVAEEIQIPGQALTDSLTNEVAQLTPAVNQVRFGFLPGPKKGNPIALVLIEWRTKRIGLSDKSNVEKYLKARLNQEEPVLFHKTP